MPLLEADGLGAMRGERTLFTGISLSVAAGDLVLLRGSNGSGKTTLLRQLAGLSEPQAGKCVRHAPHHWVGHNHGLKPYESPRRHLRHWSGVWGETPDLDAIIADIGLTRPADVPCQMLSAGQKRRSALGRLLLQDRPIWLLDEPFNALDQNGRDQLTEMMIAHRSAGGCVIAALHGETPITPDREVSL
ncbi:MAG: heme ABC exporter ATP-binding protein CcmA [Pseudomonadota bacterium]